MLTAVMLSLFSGGISAGGIIWQIFSQITFGAAGGLIISTGAVFLLKRISFQSNGFDLLLFMAIIALALLAGQQGALPCRGRKNQFCEPDILKLVAASIIMTSFSPLRALLIV